MDLDSKGPAQSLGNFPTIDVVDELFQYLSPADHASVMQTSKAMYTSGKAHFDRDSEKRIERLKKLLNKAYWRMRKLEKLDDTFFATVALAERAQRSVNPTKEEKDAWQTVSAALADAYTIAVYQLSSDTERKYVPGFQPHTPSVTTLANICDRQHKHSPEELAIIDERFRKMQWRTAALHLILRYAFSDLLSRMWYQNERHFVYPDEIDYHLEDAVMSNAPRIIDRYALTNPIPGMAVPPLGFFVNLTSSTEMIVHPTTIPPTTTGPWRESIVPPMVDQAVEDIQRAIDDTLERPL